MNDEAKATEVAVSTPEEVKKAGEAETPKAEATPEAKPEVKKEEEAVVKVSPRVQARFDAMTERMIAMGKENAELRAKTEKSAPVVQTEVTDEQIAAILSDPAQVQLHGAAALELSKRAAAREREALERNLKTETMVAASYERAKAEFPDMADTTSELWQKANEIFIRRGFANVPDGQYLAAVLASKEQAGSAPAPEVVEKQQAKEAAKTGLASVSKKAVTTTADKLATLEKEAFKAGKDSSEMMAYLRELESDRLARKKKT